MYLEKVWDLSEQLLHIQIHTYIQENHFFVLFLIVVGSKLQVGLNSRQFLLQWPQKGMYDCSQTVQWGHITEACITQPFVVCQIYFAQQFIVVECWQFGCKSPFCTRFVCCLFAGRHNARCQLASQLFHKTHKPSTRIQMRVVCIQPSITHIRMIVLLVQFWNKKSATFE